MADNTPSRRPNKPSAAVRPDVEALGVEQGSEANLPFSTPFKPFGQLAGTVKSDDEELVETLRIEGEEFGPTVRQLVAMRRMDGQATALYRLLTLPIRAALSTSTFVPAEDGEEEGDFISAVFNTPPESGGMTVTFHRFMAQMLQGLFDGFSAFEKVFWAPEHGPLQGKITLKKLAHRPAETISFITDRTGGFAGLRQRAFQNGQALDVFIPKDYAFYFAAQEEQRKFYGISFFQSAFYHYDKKVNMYYIAHLASQRDAVGTRVGTVPVTATEAAKREFANNLGNLALAQWMMVPEGFKVEMLKEGGGGSFLDYINHHNSQMSKSVLAAFFDENQGSGQNDSTLVNFAQPGDEMFMMMLRAIMDEIANQINHYIIPQLIDFNFKSGLYPKFTWGKLTDEQKAAIAKTFDTLLTAKSESITPEFVRALEEHQAEEFGLEIDYDEVDQREEEEQAAAAAGGQDPAAGGDPADPDAPPAPGSVNPDDPTDAPEGDPSDVSGNEDSLDMDKSNDWGPDDFEEELKARLTASNQAGLIELAAPSLDEFEASLSGLEFEDDLDTEDDTVDSTLLAMAADMIELAREQTDA